LFLAFRLSRSAEPPLRHGRSPVIPAQEPRQRTRFHRQRASKIASCVTRGGPMKEIGIVTLLSVVAVAAAPHGRAEKMTVFVTRKSTDAFDACLVATSVGKPTDFVLTDRGSRREIQLSGAALEGPEAQAVKQCL
jgi:hypothetical protein